MKSTILTLAVMALTGTLFAQKKIVIRGSDTLGAKMVPQLCEAYKAEGNSAEFDIAAEGSSAAFTNLGAGTCQIGMSSRSAKAEEKDSFTATGKTLVGHVAAWDMIAVVANGKNGIRKLTLKQVEGIFTGDITDWSEVGGKSGKISVYTRNTASGTYKSFQKMAMSKRDYGSNSQKMAGNEQIAEEVAGNVRGIGYVGLAYAGKKGLRVLQVDGVSAKPRNKAKYPLSRKLYYYTVGEPTGEVKKFLDWCTTSKKAAEVIDRVGFIPASDETASKKKAA